MKQTRLIMGMPITIEIVDRYSSSLFESVFTYFRSIDNRFSTYKKESEISKINRGEIAKKYWSKEMKKIFRLASLTKNQTNGYFDMFHNGTIDPSGIVKGWAIYQAACLLKKKGIKNFYIDAGGDIQVNGKNNKNERWKIGIKNPFKQEEIVKIVYLTTEGIATSGTYIRGAHIYNPHSPDVLISDIMSVTVIGPNVYEADRFATAAFAMGEKGITFLEQQKGLEGYMISAKGIATMTSGFGKYTKMQ